MKIKNPNCPTLELIILLAKYEVLIILDVDLVSNINLISKVSYRSKIEFKFEFEVVLKLYLRL